MFDWLEYSEDKDAAYCLSCFLFAKKPMGRFRGSAFTIERFRNWKKVNEGTHCSFLVHMGNGPCSPYNNAVKCCGNLKNQSQHIDKVIDKQTSEEKLNNRLRLKTSIESNLYLAYQGCPYRGHDEGPNSKNRGNFLELIKLVSNFNDDVAKVVLENAPQYAKYSLPQVQKDILHVLAKRVQDAIREEIALVAASREVTVVHDFFSNLNFIINVVSASCKRHRDLQEAQEANIAYLIAIEELETGKGANQIGTLKPAVLEKIIKEGSTYSQRGDAEAAYEMITSFRFIFILHFMREIMGTTDCLCQHLQQKSKDILNAMQLVSNTKLLLQKLRNEDWDNFLEKVVSFSKKFEIDIPDLGARYVKGRGRLPRDYITVEHHYHFDVFNAAIDFQLQELDCRFGERAMELLTLSSALDPNDAYKSFNIDDICSLVEKYYSLHFSEQEKIILRFQLKHFEVDMLNHPKLQKLSSIAELCRGLIEAGKSDTYYLIDRLVFSDHINNFGLSAIRSFTFYRVVPFISSPAVAVTSSCLFEFFVLNKKFLLSRSVFMSEDK
ncbi:uncharacterized protein LOC132178069 [Corylus avellana]|uniref:uncharacterized protein LOC132178069 n=1 Tax=Corylus avellana TaxID=13451 RepID=UPI00286AAFF6|nr:uncharacterized protein LOC132178069 [Corylus avellana]